jgi:hypothetical protein
LVKREAAIQLKLVLPATLFNTLERAAAQAHISVEQLAADCIAQAIDTALRHRVLIERQEQIDEALLTIAEFVGALAAGNADASLTPRRSDV